MFRVAKNKLLILIAILIASFFLATPTLAVGPIQAVEDANSKIINPLDNLQVKIPGLEAFSATSKMGTCTTTEGQTTCDMPWIAIYIKAIANYSFGIIGFLAAIVLMIGGVIYLASAGNTDRISTAKKFIGGSLTGLLLGLASFILLNEVNPDLIRLKSIRLNIVQNESVFDKTAFESTSLYITVGKYCGCIDWKSLTFANSKLKTTDQIQAAIKALNPNSPLTIYSQQILTSAKKYDIDPALMLAKLNVENGLATAPSGVFKVYNNLGSITCNSQNSTGQNWTCATDQYTKRYWRKYANFGDSIDDYFSYMKNSKIMQGSTSVREMISKYAPPCDNNDTTHYIDSVMSGLARYNQNAAQDTSQSISCTQKCWEICTACKNAGKTCDSATGL